MFQLYSRQQAYLQGPEFNVTHFESRITHLLYTAINATEHGSVSQCLGITKKKKPHVFNTRSCEMSSITIKALLPSPSLLRIEDLYIFRALLAHPQEALLLRHLVYCMRVMSVGCTTVGVELGQQTDMTRTQYTKCRLCIASWGWASNDRNM
jgi:hypothetical protein